MRKKRTYLILRLNIKLIKTLWYWHKDIDTYINGTKQSPEIDPYIYIYCQLIFDKDAKRIQRRKDSLLKKLCRKQLNANTINLMTF